MKPGKPLDQTALTSHPLPPVIDGDKETKGRILVLGGSREVPGAALLTATAAMRSGAGKLKIAVPQSIALGCGLAMPEAMIVGLPEDHSGGLDFSAVPVIAEAGASVDAVVGGPGMASGNICAKIASTLLHCEARLALDAALLRSLETPAVDRSTMPILLPHSGELASLLDCEEREIEDAPMRCGLEAAERFGSLVLVKGVVSHVVTPGGDAWTYDGGAPGLGVSGSGDVLAGIVGGLLARGAEPLSALLWSVWLHGEAGARLAKKVGPIGFLAREIPAEIPSLMPR